MKKVKDGGVVVIRGGEVSKEAIEKAIENKTCKIDSAGMLSQLSVQVSPKAGSTSDKKLMTKLSEALDNSTISYVYAKHILNVKGVIEYNALPDNPYHGLISNITIDDLVKVFKAN